MNEVTIGELEAQRAQLLPARETLYTSIDFDLTAALVEATNVSQALNVLAEDSSAYSEALQDISIDQS